MRAIVATGYGSPDVLRLQEVAKPTPQDGELLILIDADERLCGRLAGEEPRHAEGASALSAGWR